MDRQNGAWRDKLINYKKPTIIFCITQLLSILTIDFQIVTNKYCHKDNWSCTISSLSRMKEPKIHNIRISDIIVLIVVNSMNSSLEREFCVFHADESRRSNQRPVIGLNST